MPAPNHSCAICPSGADYRECPHPWHLPFDEWGDKETDLLAATPSGPNEQGSYSDSDPE